MKRFWRRRALVVDITCPHGEFIPATYTAIPVGHTRRLACPDCGFKIKLRWTRES